MEKELTQQNKKGKAKKKNKQKTERQIKRNPKIKGNGKHSLIKFIMFERQTSKRLNMSVN